MFTGLVEGKGKVKAVRLVQDEMELTIEPLFEVKDVRVGDSICTDGVCLTVTEIQRGALSMHVSGETLSRSTLNLLRQGDEVNLERALRLTDRLGGHLVTGHVDGTGKILSKKQQKHSWLIRIGIDPNLSRYVIEKGSIAIDGISLTVNLQEEGFLEVNIIPQTTKETTLLKKGVGDFVNIETDLIGKYVEKLLTAGDIQGGEKKPSGIDMEKLIKLGFGD